MHRVFLYLLLPAWLCFSIAYAQYNSFPPGVFSNKASRDPAPGGGGGSVTVKTNCSLTNSNSSPGVITYASSMLSIVMAPSNGGLVAEVIQLDGASAMTGMTATWQDGTNTQTMTLINSAANGNQSIWFFGLRSPNPLITLNTFTANWTNAAQVAICLTLFDGVNQTSDAAAFNNFNSATNGTPISVNITSPSNNIAVAGFSGTANFTTTNNTQNFINNGGNTYASAGNYAAGSGTATMTGNPGGANSLAAGINVSP